MTPAPRESDAAAFRRKATNAYRACVAVLVLGAAGASALGWWLGGGWGLALGATLGGLALAVGLTAATLIWAMTQDGS